MTGFGGGYDGYSMSNRARDAYQTGERPLSKWTKADILEAVERIDPDKVKLIKNVRLAVLREKLLYNSSYHHTSEFFNKTEFYMLDDYTVEELTEEIVNSWDVSKAPADLGTRYRGSIRYIVWTGTRNYPKANQKEIPDCMIEERGAFYYVHDLQTDEVILKKKINSNGTYVTNFAAEEARKERERVAREEAARIEQEYVDNSTAAAAALYKNYKETGESSRSGNYYARGRKPDSWDHDHPEEFFKAGEKRIHTDNVKKCYIIQVWTGKAWEDRTEE